MKSIKAGSLNRRISFLKQTTTQDSFGQQQATWSSVYTCWASIDIQQSQLIYATAEFVSKVTHRITFRWTSSVIFTPDLRIQYTEPTTGILHTYEIEALLNTNEGNRELVALAYEVNSAQ